MLKYMFAAALAAVALAISARAEQGLYCGNQIAVDSFYSAVTSNGSQSMVTYFAQLRNATGDSILISAHFAPPRTSGSYSNLLDIRKKLAGRGTERLALGMHKLDNPNGKGALDPAGIKAAFQLFCGQS